MKSLFTKKAPNIIGLDIGTKYIKAVSLAINGSDTKIVGFACEPIVGNAFAEREIKDFDAISRALKKVKLALKTKHKSVAIAVAGGSVISKVVYMDPNQTDFELEGQIEIEADSLIPYPLDEVYLDFEELGESSTHIGKVEVLLSAAHKDMLDARLTVVREAPFEPQIADIEGYALANAIKYFNPKGDQKSVCCINIGASLLQICVLEQDTVKYSKEHNFGTNKLVQDLAIIHNLDAQQVETTLASGNLPDSWISDTLPNFLAALQQQIQRAIQMYTSTTHQDAPSHILLAGGCALTVDICSELSRDLNITFEVFNPLAHLAIDADLNGKQLRAIAPQLSIAMGLASRSYSPWHI